MAKTNNNVLAELRNQVQLNSGKNEPAELNSKIGQIDSSLDNLSRQLSGINSNVQQRLDELGNSDQDLTSKVAETFKYLGDLDGQYKALSSKSTAIKQDIKTLALDLKSVTEGTSQNLATLNDGHADLMERVSNLSNKSKSTAQKLEKSISENAESMKALEVQLMGEINALAEVTQERDENLATRADHLDKRVEKTEAELGGHHARMLKLAAVDEALAKRASSLEAVSAELTQSSKELKNAARSLDYRTKKLEGEVEHLRQKTSLHAGLITDIQHHAAVLSQNLVRLTKLEKTHFLGILSLIVIVLAIIGGVIVSQNSSWKMEAVTNSSIQAGVSDVKSSVANLEMKLEKTVADIKDETSSLNGRVSALSPFSEFGKTSTIHGPQWIAEQPAHSYVIHLATVDSKKKLYDIASRYSHYLKNEVAFAPVNAGKGTRYALVSTGFANRNAAESALGDLPYRINWQTPRALPMAEIQASISE